MSNTAATIKVNESVWPVAGMRSLRNFGAGRQRRKASRISKKEHLVRPDDGGAGARCFLPLHRWPGICEGHTDEGKEATHRCLSSDFLCATIAVRETLKFSHSRTTGPLFLSNGIGRNLPAVFSSWLPKPGAGNRFGVLTVFCSGFSARPHFWRARPWTQLPATSKCTRR
jgi:hypothetical protein